jgi:pyruvate dehydrogenase E1 component alpha subunit
MAKAIGVKSFFYKTDDVFKLFKFLKKKINIKKNISGPLFFEFETYRWREHCGPNFDNSIGYRKESEFKKWKKKDPLLKLQKKLISLNFSLEAIQKKNKLEVLKAFEFAEKSKFPNNKKDLIETNVYAK